MNILFYGYGRHAKKIQRCIDNLHKFNINYCYLNRDIKKINNENCFYSIKDAKKNFHSFNCAFITSPNEFHLAHLKDCIENKIPYIYVEKPAIGVEEYINDIKSLDSSIKFIQVGYHYVYTPEIRQLKQLITNKSHGSLLRLDLFFGKGLAFKEEFKYEWRSKNPQAIADTLGSHLINITAFLLGRENIKQVNTHIARSTENNFYDTFHVFGLTKQSILFSLTASWGSPLNQSIKAYFSDMVWSYDMKKISKSYPRNCFNHDGFFEKPPLYEEISEHGGIKSSILYFIEKVISNKKFNSEFNNSSYINQLILEN